MYVKEFVFWITYDIIHSLDIGWTMNEMLLVFQKSKGEFWTAFWGENGQRVTGECMF